MRAACVAPGLALVLLVVFAAPQAARAFCRSRTCDPDLSECELEDGCVVSGAELYWPSDCVTFAVHAEGSRKHGISAATLERTALAAFERWSESECPDGGRPSIGAVYLGRVACDRSEFDDSVSNANIIVIRDDDWPYPGRQGVLGLTLLRFSTKTGRVDDADIEINGADHDISVGESLDGSDLDAILTHEIGHLLGLNHSSDTTATMYAEYLADASGRTLERDDVAGICAAYPPGRTLESRDCSPVNGFSGECAADQEPRAPIPPPNRCSATRARPNASSAAWLFWLGVIALLRTKRRIASWRSEPATHGSTH